MNLLEELLGIPASNSGLSCGIDTCGSIKPAAALSPSLPALCSFLNNFSYLLFQSKQPV